MLMPQFPDRQNTRFPPLLPKARSVKSPKKQANISEVVNAKSWLYYSEQGVFGYKTDVKREIASLTKIMTAMVAIQLCEKYKIVPKTTYFKVTSWASDTIGTTANLLYNAWISVEDLLYGLMLPSGNDAAIALCQNLGAVVYFDRNGEKSLIQQIRSIDLTEDQESVKIYSQQFVALMNSKARSLKMFKTKFANPHGLDHINNYSCCEDILTMCMQAIKDDHFRQIVNTISYRGTFKFYKEGKVINKYITWINTNKLLDKKDVVGIKTGITNRAGGCLATLYQTDKRTQVIIIVLGSQSTQGRFDDTVKIINWINSEILQSR